MLYVIFHNNNTGRSFVVLNVYAYVTPIQIQAIFATSVYFAMYLYEVLGLERNHSTNIPAEYRWVLVGTYIAGRTSLKSGQALNKCLNLYLQRIGLPLNLHSSPKNRRHCGSQCPLINKRAV